MNNIATVAEEPQEPQEPELIFLVEGSNWTLEVPFQEIYNNFRPLEIVEDVSGRALNYIFFYSTEKLLLNFTGDKPELGVVLYVTVKGQKKGYIIPSWKILLNYCSQIELSSKYYKELQRVVAKK